MQKLEYDLDDLKLPISEVFTNHPEKWNELINLKALLGAYLSNLERLFKGVFGQELQLEGTKDQYELFKKVFPVVGRAVDKSFGLEGFPGFCGKLAGIRSTCMHAFAKVSAMTESIDATFMRNIPNWNYRELPHVVDGNKLTLAGMLAILLCMGNKEMVAQLMASGISPFVGRIPLWNDYKFARGKDYPVTLEQRLGNDFEHEIRAIKGDDVYSSIWGEYAFRLKGTPDEFQYYSQPKGALYRARGSWKDGKLTIQKGSNYHVYFAEEYELEIADEAYFIECANQVPPFLFVAYLYRKGVRRFDRNSLSEDDKKLFPKLNKAKFYVDKNIHVILLGKAVSDQRMVYQGAVSQALYAILNLEWNLRIRHREEIERFSKYSTIKESLQVAGVEQGLIEDTLFLRNFFAHGSIFGDYVGMTDTSFRRIELLDCIDVFKRLVIALRESDPEVAESLQEDVKMRMAEQLVDMKFKALCKTWSAPLKGLRFDWVAYGKTMQRIEHSYVTEEVEDALAWFTDDDSLTRYNVYRFHSAKGMALSGIEEVSPQAKLTIAEYLDSPNFLQVLGGEPKKKPRCHGNRLVQYHEYE